MKKEINLAVTREEKVKHEGNIFLRISIWIFISCVFLSAMFIIYNIFLQSQLSSVGKDILGLENNLNSLSYKTSKITLLRERILSINELYKNRFDIVKPMNLVNKFVPGGITVELLSLNENSMVLSFSSANLSNINMLINNLYGSDSIKTYFKLISISNVTYETLSGRYLLGLELSFK